MKKSILDYFLQVFLIVFSVVLGLYLSERIEEAKEEKEAEKLVARIQSELSQNKQLLDRWVPYHGDMVDDLDSLYNDEQFIARFIDDKSAIYGVFTQGTLMSDLPSNDAWDIAKSHPLIVNVDYDIFMSLSKVYNQQIMTYENFSQIIDLLMSSEFNAAETARQNLRLFREKLDDIHSRELQLVYYYQKTGEVLAY